MKKKLLFILLLFTIMGTVSAQVMREDEFEDYSIVIGSHLFTEESNPNTGYKGYLTTKFAMLGASTLKDASISNMIIYYKYGEDDWADFITDETVETPESFNITHLNGACIDPSCMGSAIKITFQSTAGLENIFTTSTTRVNYGGKISGEAIPKLNNRPGYKFICWTLEGSDDCFSLDTAITEDTIPEGKDAIVLESKWEQIEYTVTYHANFGEDETNDFTCHYYDATHSNNCKFLTYATTGLPSRENYTFLGWATSASGTTIYEPETEMAVILEDKNVIELYAVWSTDEFKITYLLDGGTFATTANIMYSFNTETEQILLVNPEKVGYKFVSWQFENTDFDGSQVPKESITLTAKWEPITYQFTYKNRNNVSKTIACTYDIKCDLLFDVVEIDGQQFNGLYILENATKIKLPDYVKNYTFEDEKSYTVIDEYKPLLYTIYYDYNGGLSETGNIQQFNFSSSDTSLNQVTYYVPKRQGYVFDGYDILDDSSLGTFENDKLLIRGASDIKLKAKWIPIQFTFTYDNQTKECYYDAPCKIDFEVPTMVGKTFKYWYREENGEEIKVDNDVTNYSFVKTDYTLKPKFANISYSITYDYDGGTVKKNNPVSFDIEHNVILLNKPEKQGYVFKGWKIDDSEEVITEDTFTISVQKDVKVLAVWEERDITITYNVDGVETTEQCKYTTCLIKEEQPTKNLFLFDGWIDENGLVYQSGSKMNILDKDTITLTVKWTNKYRYTISYDLKGGQFASDGNGPVSYLENEIIEIPDLIKEGYIFNGWELDGTIIEKNDGKTIIRERKDDIHLVANFTPIQYSFKYKEQEPIVCTYDIECSLDFTKEEIDGKQLIGFYIMKDGKKISLPDKVKNFTNVNETEPYVVLAAYEVNDYSITYDYQGGATLINNPTTYNVDNNIKTLNEPTKVGYTFTGWQIASGNGTFEGNVVTITGSEDIKLVAQFRPNTYKFTYDSNVITCTYDVGCDATFTANTVAGKTLREAYVMDNGQKRLLPDDLTNFTTRDAVEFAITTVYATLNYDISYNYDGGLVENENPTTYTVADRVVQLNEPIKAGYTFIGWQIDESKATVSEGNRNEYTIQVTEDITFTALWEINTYKIIFHKGDAEDTVIDEVTCTYGEECTFGNHTSAFASTTRLLGWATSKGGNLYYGDNLTVRNLSLGDNIDLYAVIEDITPSYKVYYYADGGELDGIENSSLDVAAGSVITLPIARKDGYVFKGWQDMSSGVTITDTSVIVASDMMLKAVWEEEPTATPDPTPEEP